MHRVAISDGMIDHRVTRVVAGSPADIKRRWEERVVVAVGSNVMFYFPCHRTFSNQMAGLRCIVRLYVDRVPASRSVNTLCDCHARKHFLDHSSWAACPLDQNGIVLFDRETKKIQFLTFRRIYVVCSWVA